MSTPMLCSEYVQTACNYQQSPPDNKLPPLYVDYKLHYHDALESI